MMTTRSPDDDRKPKLMVLLDWIDSHLINCFPESVINVSTLPQASEAGNASTFLLA